MIYSIIFAAMLVQTTNIQGTSGSRYDAFLAAGWFRGTGIIYRSEIVCIDSDIYAVQHIRLPLGDYLAKKRHRKLLRNNDNRFRVEIGNPMCDERREELYKAHTTRFKAFLHHSLSDILSGPNYQCGFECLEMRVFDGEKLVAVSYFDISEKAGASILCLYDFDYARYSLGHYTLLKEIEYAKSRGMAHYYPGYILDRPSSFDYKLTIGDCEWMGMDRKWYTPENLRKRQSKADIIREKMAELKVIFATSGIQAEKRVYPYFTIGQLMADRDDLIKLPCFFAFEYNGLTYGASYDLSEDSFVIFDFEEADDLEFTQHLALSDDYKEGNHYELRILRCNFYITIQRFQMMTGVHNVLNIVHESL